MKTLSFTVGLLLLLAASYCTAMPHGVNEIAPVRCCFKFYTGGMRQAEIINIIKTHSSCREKGFVVSTAKGHEICVSLNLKWAQRAFNQRQPIKN
ncbi:C-C motif chemokine 4-like [Micropterus dolomieu]|uniref:C-C motif chemokine 4-like n=1 Tax=Micropterus dolomieu TaxID=147949 RepID=UPI001E8D7E8D|nr:C-C motif chemokine 4-like [Micropterus dolomieu]